MNLIPTGMTAEYYNQLGAALGILACVAGAILIFVVWAIVEYRDSPAYKRNQRRKQARRRNNSRK